MRLVLATAGWLAQLGEHRPYKARVGGSIPSPPTNHLMRDAIDCELSENRGPVVQLVRMPACHAGGRGFESRPVRHYFKKLLSSDCSFFYACTMWT